MVQLDQSMGRSAQSQFAAQEVGHPILIPGFDCAARFLGHLHLQQPSSPGLVEQLTDVGALADRLAGRGIELAQEGGLEQEGEELGGQITHHIGAKELVD